MNLFKNNKIAIFSDLHIGVHRDSKFWHDVSQEWALWYISELKTKGITDIVFLGDYYHTRDEVSVDSLSFGTKLLKLFKDFNLHLLVGNHDCFLKDSATVNSISPYNEWSNVTVYDKAFVFKHNEKTISFIPWGTELNDIPKADITFGHFEINLFKMNSFALCEDGFTADELLQKSPLVISGHFHLKDQRNYSDGTILYVGNPFQMDFNDAGSVKGYYTLDLTDNKLEFTENTISPKHVNLTMSHLISEKKLTDNIRKLINKNLIKFRVDKRTSSEDLEFIISKLREFEPLDFIIEHKTDICEYNLEEEKKDLSGIDLEKAIGEFVEEMDVNNKQEILKYTLELLNKYKN